MNDIVITYDSSINLESRLKMILRCIEKEFTGFNEIVLIGPKPEWLQGVIHIDFSNCESKRFKIKNDLNKLKAASISRLITDSFVWVDAGDQLSKLDARKAFRISLMEGDEFYIKPKSSEVIIKKHTDSILERRGFGLGYNFFTKYPITFSKDRLLNTFDDADFETPYGYCIKSLYVNFNRFKATDNLQHVSLIDYKEFCSYELKNI